MHPRVLALSCVVIAVCTHAVEAAAAPFETSTHVTASARVTRVGAWGTDGTELTLAAGSADGLFPGDAIVIPSDEAFMVQVTDVTEHGARGVTFSQRGPKLVGQWVHYQGWQCTRERGVAAADIKAPAGTPPGWVPVATKSIERAGSTLKVKFDKATPVVVPGAAVVAFSLDGNTLHGTVDSTDGEDSTLTLANVPNTAQAGRFARIFVQRSICQKAAGGRTVPLPLTMAKISIAGPFAGGARVVVNAGSREGIMPGVSLYVKLADGSSARLTAESVTEHDAAVEVPTTGSYAVGQTVAFYRRACVPNTFLPSNVNDVSPPPGFVDLTSPNYWTSVSGNDLVVTTSGDHADVVPGSAAIVRTKIAPFRLKAIVTGVTANRVTVVVLGAGHLAPSLRAGEQVVRVPVTKCVRP